jgi:hypothetical protein
MDIAKVDPDVAYIAIVIHVCCKRLFQMFHLFSNYVASIFLDVAYVPHKCVASVLSRCCIYLQWLSSIFQVFQICYKSFSCFGRILQVFRLDVAKVDMGLYMLQWNPPATATCSSCWVAAVGRRAGT